MYDPATANLIRNAPDLKNLDVARLPEKLSSDFAEIAAARIRLRDHPADSERLTEILDFATRLALTNEALVAVAPDRQNRRAAAFVAATAHQLVFQVNSLFAESGPPYLAQHAISSDIAAVLLFLIAQSTADAAEVARIMPYAEGGGIESELIEAIRHMARGDLTQLPDPSDVERPALGTGTPAQHATTALYYRIFQGVCALGRRLTKPDVSTEKAETIFRHVQKLSGLEGRDVEPAALPSKVSAFAGPHHLASLLMSVADALGSTALVAIPPPRGIDEEAWKSMIRRVAEVRPYVWENQAYAIERGYLEEGVSAAVAFPTGAGKSMVSQMKISATLLRNHRVVFLAPTHALVDQTIRDLQRAFPDNPVRGEHDDDSLAAVLDALPEIMIMTPEACLARMHFQPEVFRDVGLLVFDECHLLHPRDATDRRAIDAMLCVLNFVRLAPEADLLLVSAMMRNTREMADWVANLTGKAALDLSLEWKPTRQLRGCVVYDSSALEELERTLEHAREKRRTASVPAAVRKALLVEPHGLFSVQATWESTNRSDYTFLPFLDEPVQLGTNSSWGLTPNAGRVSAALAAAAAQRGIKVLVFMQSITNAFAAAKRLRDSMGRQELRLTPQERRLLAAAIDEVGDPLGLYLDIKGNQVMGPVGVHHGQLLPDERRLTERLFMRDDGLSVLVATPTLAQGMNLPSECVIIAEDSRYDFASSRRRVLDAQELLNAAGRAGRAGQNATGMVVVIPGKVVSFNNEENTVGRRWATLRKVFGQSDQCLVIDDPITAVLDRIHAATTGDVGDLDRYCIMRLTQPLSTRAEAGDAEGEFKGILRRSLGVHRKREANREAWVESRTEAATSLLGEPECLSTEQMKVRNIAANTGLPEDIIANLREALETVRLGVEATVHDWCRWLIEWIGRHPSYLPRILKPEDLETQFGKAYKDFEEDEDRAGYAIPHLRKLLACWLEGGTLGDMQALLPKNSREEAKFTGARKFVTKIVPSLMPLASLPAMILGTGGRAATEEGATVSAVVSALGRCVRRGYDTVELAALHDQYSLSRPSRRGMHREVQKLRGYLRQGKPGETWEAVLDRVQDARLAQMMWNSDRT